MDLDDDVERPISKEGDNNSSDDIEDETELQEEDNISNDNIEEDLEFQEEDEADSDYDKEEGEEVDHQYLLNDPDTIIVDTLDDGDTIIIDTPNQPEDGDSIIPARRPQKRRRRYDRYIRKRKRGA